jgi:hypothetical protein
MNVQVGARDGESLSAREPNHSRFAAEMLDAIAIRAAGLTAEEAADRLRRHGRTSMCCAAGRESIAVAEIVPGDIVLIEAG